MKTKKWVIICSVILMSFMLRLPESQARALIFNFGSPGFFGYNCDPMAKADGSESCSVVAGAPDYYTLAPSPYGLIIPSPGQEGRPVNGAFSFDKVNLQKQAIFGQYPFGLMPSAPPSKTNDAQPQPILELQ